jgi:hypothetical protein
LIFIYLSTTNFSWYSPSEVVWSGGGVQCHGH